MKPEMVDRDAFTVMGVVTRVRRGSETPELFGEIWSRLEACRRELEPVSVSKEFYGVSFATGEMDVTDYLAGVMVSSEAAVPEGLEKRPVPASRYAVFECPVEGIGACYREVFTAWLPGAGMAFDPTVPVFEEYPENTPAEPVRIHIPVRGSGSADGSGS